MEGWLHFSNISAAYSSTLLLCCCCTARVTTHRHAALQRSHNKALRAATDARADAVVMNLDNVLPIPLDNNDYVKTAMELVLDGGVTQKVLQKQLQNVCVVYSSLGIKRNAGIVSMADKRREVCKGFKEIAVPGFFKWAKDSKYNLPAWLTFEKMACTTSQSGEQVDADQSG